MDGNEFFDNDNKNKHFKKSQQIAYGKCLGENGLGSPAKNSTFQFDKDNFNFNIPSPNITLSNLPQYQIQCEIFTNSYI